MSDEARLAAERTARASYGRLLALLTARTRDVAAAEDALSDAFTAALDHWPRTGPPTSPEAWLLTTARRKLTDRARRAATHNQSADVLTQLAQEAEARSMTNPAFPDERLKLLCVCAHPAIDPGARTPLMLQTVLGLDAARIASVFLVKPAAMGQRLLRAKTKIKAAGIAFVEPDPADLPKRLAPVLDAIYAAYGAGWSDATGADARTRGLADEAVFLARLVRELAPEAGEAHGLLALMLHCEARRGARRSATGAFVPLSQQNTRLWDHAMIDEAEDALRAALSPSKPGQTVEPGRFTLEAAIQSAHARRAWAGDADWPAIVQLYDALIARAPTLGALISRAAAVCEAQGAAAALVILDELASAQARRIGAYQPYWAARAHVLAELRDPDADKAYARAIGLAEDPAVIAFLAERRARLDRA